MAVKVFCKSCGKANSRDSEVCIDCGNPLKRSTTARKIAEVDLAPLKGLERGGSVTATHVPHASQSPTVIHSKCPQCGRANSGSNRFCNGCGARLDEGHVPPPQKPAGPVYGRPEDAELDANAADSASEPRPHRENAAFCPDCGTLNVGHAHCIECGAVMAAPAAG